MKTLSITMTACMMLMFASCKKETVVEQTTTTNADGSTTTTTKTTTDYDLMRLRKAETDYNNAEQEVVLARERGDTKGEEIARRAADKAKEAWEVTKREVKKGADKTKEAFQDVKEETKEGYNNAVEKAKAE